MKRISVIGAGNGGQALAGHLAMLGCEVVLYNRDIIKLRPIHDMGGIHLKGCINGFGAIKALTDDLAEAVSFAEIILIVTTANAHKELAYRMSSFLKEGQIVLLSPGRTFGALEFRNCLEERHFSKRIYVAETQTLIFACRLERIGIVNIIGIKKNVFFSAYPSVDNLKVYEEISKLYGCFTPVKNILITGLENIGAILHPAIYLFNAAVIERGEQFYFYRQMTAHIASFITQVDNVRLLIGLKLGLNLISVEDWITFAYPEIRGNDLCEKIKNNPAYYDILGPKEVYSRQLLEDVPMGILPLMDLGECLHVDVSLLKALYEMASAFLNMDFRIEGRSFQNLKINLSVIEKINGEK